MKITIDMIEIQTETEYKKEKEAFLNWIEDFGDYEKVILRQFIEEEKLPVELMASGIYFINLVPGTGKKIEPGDTITINYEGRFLNGKFFDSTVKRSQPFQFVYGTEWQVVKGLEEAIGMMKEGEKSLVILPSDLAFGSEGSSTGMIPPFTSLIFEVEILEVISPAKI
jgi:FKBP-type peptidyl-prolyl cis-trans isomerase